MSEPVPVRIFGADKREHRPNEKYDRTLHVAVFVLPGFESDPVYAAARYPTYIVKNQARRSWVNYHEFYTLAHIAAFIARIKQGSRKIMISINTGYEEDLKAEFKAERWKNVSITSERVPLATFPDL